MLALEPRLAVLIFVVNVMWIRMAVCRTAGYADVRLRVKLAGLVEQHV